MLIKILTEAIFQRIHDSIFEKSTLNIDIKFVMIPLTFGWFDNITI